MKFISDILQFFYQSIVLKMSCFNDKISRVSEFYISSDDEDDLELGLNMNEDNEENEENEDNEENGLSNNKIYRSYTETCEKDSWNIRRGRCPDYALDWGDDFNQLHWPIGHDYINGYEDALKRDEFDNRKKDKYNEWDEKFEELSKMAMKGLFEDA
jgi:hypothetical protein